MAALGGPTTSSLGLGSIDSIKLINQLRGQGLESAIIGFCKEALRSTLP